MSAQQIIIRRLVSILEMIHLRQKFLNHIDDSGPEAIVEIARVVSDYPHIGRVITRHELELLPLRETGEADYWQSYQDIIRTELRDRILEIPDTDMDEREFLWWLYLIAEARFPKEYQLEYLKSRIDFDWDGFCDSVKKLKQSGALPRTMSPEEFAASMFDPVRPVFRPGDPYLRVLDVRSVSELKSLGSVWLMATLSQKAFEGELNPLFKTYTWAIQREFRGQGSHRPRRSNSFDDHQEAVFPSEPTAQNDAKILIDDIIQKAGLSRTEAVIVDGWRTGELPPPGGGRQDYGSVKEFTERHSIPYKSIHTLQKRALTKLQSVLAA